jgi:hypothetical protein
MRRYEAIRLGEVAGNAVPMRLERSKGITRVGPVWCSDAGSTSTGIAGTRGLAADVYSKKRTFSSQEWRGEMGEEEGFMKNQFSGAR